MSSGKKYGLILPGSKTQKPVFQASRNVFGDDSDTDDDFSKKPVLTRPSGISSRQDKITQQKAVNDDPTVYQYDEIYESLSKKVEKPKSKEEKKPKYIENLLKTASKRKVENERRIERQIQKEREKEGDEFADKEVFVTSAYKKKLEEMRLEEEKEKREEYLESIGDVTKQQDLGGFYRHLYEQKLGTNVNNKTDQVPDAVTDAPSSDTTKTDEKEGFLKSSQVSKSRNYRKRKQSDSADHLSEGEIELSDEETNRISLQDIKEAKKLKQDDNIDADSDFNNSSEDDEEDTKNEHIKSIQPEKQSNPITPNQESTTNDAKGNDKDSVQYEKEKVCEIITPPEIPKIDIWKKRTVGEVFQQALQRYYERKAARGS